MIFETIISTVDLQGKVHVTPFGVRKENGLAIIAPFKPSTTLNNILTTKCAVMNLTDDVRVFASGIVKHHQNYALTKAGNVNGFRLTNSLAHQELRLVSVVDDEQRPELHMEIVHQESHQAFQGFNRAQAAVIELAVLTSRLHMLPKEKVMDEKAYLKIAIDKTAGERELEAWQWLEEKLMHFYENTKND